MRIPTKLKWNINQSNRRLDYFSLSAVLRRAEESTWRSTPPTRTAGASGTCSWRRPPPRSPNYRLVSLINVCIRDLDNLNFVWWFSFKQIYPHDPKKWFEFISGQKLPKIIVLLHSPWLSVNIRYTQCLPLKYYGTLFRTPMRHLVAMSQTSLIQNDTYFMNGPLPNSIKLFRDMFRTWPNAFTSLNCQPKKKISVQSLVV